MAGLLQRRTDRRESRRRQPRDIQAAKRERGIYFRDDYGWVMSDADVEREKELEAAYQQEVERLTGAKKDSRSQFETDLAEAEDQVNQHYDDYISGLEEPTISFDEINVGVADYRPAGDYGWISNVSGAVDYLDGYSRDLPLDEQMKLIKPRPYRLPKSAITDGVMPAIKDAVGSGGRFVKKEDSPEWQRETQRLQYLKDGDFHNYIMDTSPAKKGTYHYNTMIQRWKKKSPEELAAYVEAQEAQLNSYDYVYSFPKQRIGHHHTVFPDYEEAWGKEKQKAQKQYDQYMQQYNQVIDNTNEQRQAELTNLRNTSEENWQGTAAQYDTAINEAATGYDDHLQRNRDEYQSLRNNLNASIQQTDMGLLQRPEPRLPTIK